MQLRCCPRQRAMMALNRPLALLLIAGGLTTEALERSERPGSAGNIDIDNIYSVGCLKAKIRYGPSHNCDGKTASENEEKIVPQTLVPAFGVGSYPNWRDASCHSGGEFLCDPEALMTPDVRQKVVHELQDFRVRSLIECGQLDARLGAGSDVRHRRHFNLGIAIARDWPSSEVDPTTLQKFGMILLARWGLLPWYNGIDMHNAVEDTSGWEQYTANCPNAAMLILLPKYREAFISSPSCEFLCQDRGGPEVMAAVLAAMDNAADLGDGAVVAAAAQAGIAAAQRILEDTFPLSLTRQKTPHEEEKDYLVDQMRFLRRDSTWILAQRAFLAFVMVSIVVCLAGFAASNLAPSREKDLRGSRFG